MRYAVIWYAVTSPSQATRLRGILLQGSAPTARVGKKATSLKKANFSRLKWIKPDNILGFFKHRVFSKMRH